MLLHKKKQKNFMSEINVTPMVDVMLVLLVIFMVTAPMMILGINVDLPKVQAKNLEEKKEPLVISLNPKGKIYIQDIEIPEEQLISKLIAITGTNSTTRIFIRADKNIIYEKVMKIMSSVSSAGFTKVALIAELPNTSNFK